MSTGESETSFFNQVAEKLAADPSINETELQAIAEAWKNVMAGQKHIRGQQAVTEAFRHDLSIPGASPHAILSGEYGEEAQGEFLRGATLAIQLVMETQLETKTGTE